MSLEKSSNQSKNGCSPIDQDDEDYNDAAHLTRELSLKIIASTCRHSPTTKTSASVPTATRKRNRASPLHVHLFATILEDVLTQLRILGECNIVMQNYKIQFDMNELRDEKYGIMPCEHEDELFGIDPKNLECDGYKLCKHAADRNTCFTILSNTYLELALNGTHEALIKHRETVEDRYDHFLFLINEEAKNKEIRRNLRRQVRQQRIHIKSSVYETNLIMEKLIAKFEDSAVIKSAQERYIDKWENSRAEQNNMRIQDKETDASSTITKYRNKLDDEQRVHSEMENLIKIKVCETLRQIEECMSKYDKDIETMDFKITVMRVNHEKQVETRLELEQKLAEHDVEMKKYIQFKKDREKLREYQIKMEAAAIIVQAWWRGLLVRLELGPFKPSLQKKKKNKKKKK